MADINQSVALDVKPVDIMSPLLKAAQFQQMQASTQNLQTEAARREYDLRSEELGRAAKSILQTPEGSPERLQRWNAHVDDLANRGYLNRVEAAQWRDNPSNLILNQAIARATPVGQHAEMTGETAGAKAKATAPFEYRPMNPTERAGYPALQEGGPMGQGPATGQFGTPGAPGVAPPQPGPGGYRAPPGTQNITDNEIRTPPPQPPQAAAPAGQPAPAPAPQPTVQNQYYSDAPTVQVGQKLQGGKGIVTPGIDPIASAAKEQALDVMNKDIVPKANAAQQSKAELLQLDNMIKSGKVDTNKWADFKLGVGAQIFAATGNAELAQKVSGQNVPWTEAFQKEAVRRGLTFVRQTEGAREAVQAILIGLQANPSLLNTPPGNLLMIKAMTAGNDYDIERARAAQGYLLKQQDATGVGHLQGFDNWFNQDNSPSHFVSRAVPTPLPPEQGALKNNMTYEIPMTDASGKAQIGQDGKPVMRAATYNTKTKTFTPVQ